MTDDPLNVPDDGPDSSFRRQPPGDTVFFWIDGTGHTKAIGMSRCFAAGMKQPGHARRGRRAGTGCAQERGRCRHARRRGGTVRAV